VVESETRRDVIRAESGGDREQDDDAEAGW